MANSRKPHRRLTEGEAIWAAGFRPDLRDGQPGLRFQDLFIPALSLEEKPGTIVAAPAEWGPGVLGATVWRCWTCKRPVLLAPTGARLAFMWPSVPVVCTPCLMKDIGNRDLWQIHLSDR